MVNARLIWTSLLVGELITPALRRGLYGPHGHGWHYNENNTLLLHTNIKAIGLMFWRNKVCVCLPNISKWELMFPGL